MTMAAQEWCPEHISPDVWRRAGVHPPVSPRYGRFFCSVHCGSLTPIDGKAAEPLQ